MSELASPENVLDPERPWIEDPRDLPSGLNWLQTLFNPSGTSSKLHFTRAWTVLFFAQFLIVVLPFFIAFIVGLAGGDGGPITTAGLYASPLVFLVTTIMSFVIHCRRLNDAGKSFVWAVPIVIALFAAIGIFTMGLSQKAAEYDELYQERAVYLEDPRAWQESQLEKRREEQAEAAKAREEAQASGEETGQQGRQGGGNRGDWNRGPSADQDLPGQVEFILRPNAGAVQMVLIPFGALMMLLSLLWIARLPAKNSDPVAR